MQHSRDQWTNERTPEEEGKRNKKENWEKIRKGNVKCWYRKILVALLQVTILQTNSQNTHTVKTLYTKWFGSVVCVCALRAQKFPVYSKEQPASFLGTIPSAPFSFHPSSNLPLLQVSWPNIWSLFHAQHKFPLPSILRPMAKPTFKMSLITAFLILI